MATLGHHRCEKAGSTNFAGKSIPSTQPPLWAKQYFDKQNEIDERLTLTISKQSRGNEQGNGVRNGQTNTKRCYESGMEGHFKRNCPVIQRRGNGYRAGLTDR